MNKKTTEKKRSELLKTVRYSIPYIKELRNLEDVKSVNACLLMSQLEYWFMISGNGFYKFAERPETEQFAYKDGDSWTEELGISYAEFINAFEQIGVRYKSKKEYDEAKSKGDVFQGKFYCCYFNKVNRLTLHFRNDKKVNEAIRFLRELKTQTLRNEDSQLTDSTNSVRRIEENAVIEKDNLSLESTDTTTDNTTEIRENELSCDKQDSHSDFRFVEEFETSNKEVSREKSFIGSSDDDDNRTLYDIYWDTMEGLEKQGISQKPIPIPDDFEPDYNMMFWAKNTYPLKMIGIATEKFIDYFKSKGQKSCNWKLKWKKWIIDEREISNPSDNGEVRAILTGELCDNDILFSSLFEEFLLCYRDWGLVPLTEFYNSFPHLLKETIHGALTNQTFVHEFVIHENRVYSKNLYKHYNDYRISVDKGIVALEKCS